MVDCIKVCGMELSGYFCKILQINKVNKFSKLLTFINGGGNAAHKILRIFAIEKTDYDIK